MSEQLLAVVVVCLPTSEGNPGGFDDNLYAACSRCGTEVQYRPHTPEPSTKACLSCAWATIARDGSIELGATAETLEDVRRWKAAR